MKRLSLLALALATAAAAQAQPPAGYSEHAAQSALTAAEEPPAPAAKDAAPGDAKAVSPNIKNDRFVVLGYAQSNTPVFGFHWHALTHIAIPFTDFNSNGDLTNVSSTITNRSFMYRPGGIADRHGVKVIMTLRNSGFDTAVLDAVMLDATRRSNLATAVANIVNSPSDNLAGVNLDFEPVPYSTGVGAAIGSFIADLRTKLNPGKEISYYVGPTYYASSYPNLATMAANLDYFNISCYPYSGSWSNTSTAVTPLNSYSANVDRFLSNGVPADKMVLTLGSYGYRMETASPAYGATKVANIGSTGFADAKFQVTYASPRQTRLYQTGAEAPYYAAPLGSNFDHVVYDDEESLDIKMRGALGWTGAQSTGRPLRGVGYWSLAWMAADFLGGHDAGDMETGAVVNKIRTYPHVYQRIQEIFAPPGTTSYILEKWEFDSTSITTALRSEWDRWRDPTEGNDDVGVTAAGTNRAIVALPTMTGAPANSAYCVRLNYSFTATPNNKFFYRWEILGDANQPTIRDFNATSGFFDRTTKVSVDVYTASPLAGRTIRFVILDGNGQVELGPAISLNASGWRTLSIDLNSATFTGYNTTFNQYFDGDGVLNTAGGGARDLAVAGFLVEGGGTGGTGTLHLDELRYEHANPGGADYVINEFRYATTTQQFIEIHGPAGPFPAGTELRLVDGANGLAYDTISLAGLNIPNDGGGRGFFVIGTSAVANVDLVKAVGFIQSGAPDAMQLYNTSTATIYDSVVYESAGGVGSLDGPREPLVTTKGYPWLGEIGPGTEVSAANGGYTLGRYPDGRNLHVNAWDFGALAPTPGQPNGGAITTLPIRFDFDNQTPPRAISTYQAFSVVDLSSGSPIPASPQGGRAHRAVDASGGGVISFIGDAALGANGAGYSVSGHFFIPSSSTPAHAIGLGFCGSQGSVFFAPNVASFGYESGYWLIYENAAGVNLNDGLTDAPDTFRFVHATNDGIYSPPVTSLASVPRSSITGATAGQWATFYFSIDPAQNRLIAEINGSTVYSGVIPAGGPTSGAFQVGYRENRTATPANPTAAEGGWVDTLVFGPAGYRGSGQRTDSFIIH